jgi:hypothetical protein
LQLRGRRDRPITRANAAYGVPAGVETIRDGDNGTILGDWNGPKGIDIVPHGGATFGIVKNWGLTPFFQLSLRTEYQTRSATSIRPSLVRARRR